MLRYTQGSQDSPALIHHDDHAGAANAPYDAGAELALAAAAEHDFTVVSVRDDWSSVFVPQGAGTA